MDVESITKELICLGVEFDGSHYWVTGTYAFGNPKLHRISPDGTLVNTYPQPGMKTGDDLAWDGQYLYTTDGFSIIQISTANGQQTGVTYGPFPVIIALAYDAGTDSFWASSYDNPVYQCFRDGSFNTYPNPGLDIYGAALEASDPGNPMLWLWSRDGPTGSLASEYDPRTHVLTGRAFPGTHPLGGIAGGACAYHLGGGMWEFVAMSQGIPDYIAGYDLDTAPITLKVDVKEISAKQGGSAQFALTAGGAHGGRGYGLFGSLSGTNPGTPLPGGMAILPINWDGFTSVLITYGFAIGILDPSGSSSETLVVPGNLIIPGDLLMSFAYCLQGPPWDFASNPVHILLSAGPD